MTAYELARALRVESSQMEYGYVVDNWELLDNAAKMLRQQADRIAHLEMLIANRNEIIDKLNLTPQTKPLSDEEIITMADSLALIHYYDSDGEWSGITNEPMFRAGENRNNERLLEILKPFARAIEERHGIK